MSAKRDGADRAQRFRAGPSRRLRRRRRLSQKVLLHVTALMTELVSRDRGSPEPVPTTGRLTAPLPDVRVKPSLGFVLSPLDEQIDVIAVTVENRSPVTYFHFERRVRTRVGVEPAVRARRSGEPDGAAELAPGDALSLHVSGPQIVKGARGERVVCAFATSKIGHAFRSDPAKFPDLAHEFGQRR